MAKTKTTSADKRSVSTDALETLGTAPLGENEARDAIHLAVEPVIAGQRLFAGQDVGLVQSAGGLVAMSTGNVKHLGIVDPFLHNPVQPGERFWLVVYPRQIKSLRHVWEHPDFSPSSDLKKEPSVPFDQSQAVEATKQPLDHFASMKSKDWLLDYAESINVDYDWLIDNAEQAQRGWHYVCHPEDSGYFEGMSLPSDFWHHYATATGKVVKDDRTSFFTCAC